MPLPEPLFRRAWDAAALLAAHPPRISHPNKRVVDAIARPPGAAHRGVVVATRWAAGALPERIVGGGTVEEVDGYYAYGPAPDGAIAWHQNFADPALFGFYGGPLFAQDEVQVAEHPALASVREAMAVEGHAATVGADGPTPVLVAGVERRCAVDTAPAPGRPGGLYGNRFAAADAEAVRAATTRLDPPTVSNVVAVAAPYPAQGRYTAGQIRGVLGTAYTAYAAVVAESAALAPGARVVVNTGFWGCGAFGGNRALMVALQALAASMAGVPTIVFHLGDATGKRAMGEARAVLAEIGDGEASDAAVERLVARGFAWGASDGN